MTKIKICGIMHERDVGLANRFLPDYIGFVIACPKSKRNLSIQEAGKLLELADQRIKKVAVTVSPEAETIRQIEKYQFDYIQIHGKVRQEVWDQVSLPVIRAVQQEEIDSFSREKQAGIIDAYLFDSKKPGSGESFDWSILKNVETSGKMMFLAGGIDEYNVEEAIKQVRPDVIDVSSSVELGVIDGHSVGKDPEKMEKMIRMVHDAE